MPLSHPKDVTTQSNRVRRKVLKSFIRLKGSFVLKALMCITDRQQNGNRFSILTAIIAKISEPLLFINDLCHRIPSDRISIH